MKPVPCNACGKRPFLFTENGGQRILFHALGSSCDARNLYIADPGGEPLGEQPGLQGDDSLIDRWNTVMLPPALRDRGIEVSEDAAGLAARLKAQAGAGGGQ